MKEIQTAVHHPEHVFVKLHDYKGENGEDAKLDLRLGETEVEFRGIPTSIVELASGICMVLDVAMNEDAKTQEDFIGFIPRNVKGNLPQATVRLTRTPAKLHGMLNQVYLQIGGRSMNFGTKSMEEAQDIVFGLTQLLNIPPRDKFGRLYQGQVVVE